jgi:mRNA interferase RelE/StbE
VTEQPYRLTFTPAALRELEKLDAFIRRKVFSEIEKLTDNPRPHGVEKLETKGKLYRLHVGPGKNYRVLYEIRDEILLVLVVRVGNRKEVYRRLR